jgi:hypothetical protein
MRNFGAMLGQYFYKLFKVLLNCIRKIRWLVLSRTSFLSFMRTCAWRDWEKPRKVLAIVRLWHLVNRKEEWQLSQQLIQRSLTIWLREVAGCASDERISISGRGWILVFATPPWLGLGPTHLSSSLGNKASGGPRSDSLTELGFSLRQLFLSFLCNILVTCVTFPWRKGGLSVKLTTNLSLVSTLRMHGVWLPLLPYVRTAREPTSVRPLCSSVSRQRARPHVQSWLASILGPHLPSFPTLCQRKWRSQYVRCVCATYINSGRVLG